MIISPIHGFNFPDNQTPEVIELDILNPSDSSATALGDPKKIGFNDGKTDFEKRNRISKELGERGEKFEKTPVNYEVIVNTKLVDN
jgi:hypothetical protein